jgi:hypothetical protein
MGTTLRPSQLCASLHPVVFGSKARRLNFESRRNFAKSLEHQLWRSSPARSAKGGYQAPRTISVSTGHLRVVRLDSEYRYRGPQRHSWYDRKGKPVEDQIKDILRGFYELALSQKDVPRPSRRSVSALRRSAWAKNESRVRKETESSSSSSRLMRAPGIGRATFAVIYVRYGNESRAPLKRAT